MEVRNVVLVDSSEDQGRKVVEEMEMKAGVALLNKERGTYDKTLLYADHLDWVTMVVEEPILLLGER